MTRERKFAIQMWEEVKRQLPEWCKEHLYDNLRGFKATSVSRMTYTGIVFVGSVNTSVMNATDVLYTLATTRVLLLRGPVSLMKTLAWKLNYRQ